MLEINTIYNLDYLDFLKKLDDNSIDCFITSPPYFRMRDYEIENQLGMEEYLEDYIDK